MSKMVRRCGCGALTDLTDWTEVFCLSREGDASAKVKANGRMQA
jgi:hypothetical protein